MDTLDLGMTFIGIGFGSLLCVLSIGIATYGIVWLIKQCKKRKSCQIESVPNKYRDIWTEAVALTIYEKSKGIITEEKYKEQVNLHITRMLAMILD